MTLGTWPPESRARRIAYSLLKRESELQSIAKTADRWGYTGVAASIRKACADGSLTGYLWDAIHEIEGVANREEGIVDDEGRFID